MSQRAGDRCRARVHAELLVCVIEVLANGVGGDDEQRRCSPRRRRSSARRSSRLAFRTTRRVTAASAAPSAALEKIIDARVWGGIHFRTADVQGAGLGKKVARW